MSAESSRPLRTVMFGGLDNGPWGAAWSAGTDLFLLAAAPDSAAGQRDGVGLDGAAASEPWRLSGAGAELEISGQGEPASFPDREGFEQLCRVRGTVALDDGELTIDALGMRAEQARIERGSADSLRQLGLWFEEGDGMAVTALRPRKPRGHAGDVVHAALLDPSGAPTVVAEPRLSTTYGAEGTPSRAGLELWLENENEHYVRRAAGSAVSSTRASDANVELQAVLLRWKHRGRDGSGVYLLAQPR